MEIIKGEGNNMLTASEARKKLEEYKPIVFLEILLEIEKQIIKACKNGENTCIFCISRKKAAFKELREFLNNELEQAGYKVTTDRTSNCREYCFNISW